MKANFIVWLIAGLVIASVAACSSATPAPKPAAPVVQSDGAKVVATLQVPKGLFEIYSDPDGNFAILYPRGWQVIPQKTTNVLRVSTLFQGPQGHVAVLQFDNGQPPVGPIDRLADGVLQQTGVRGQPGYKEIARTPMPDGGIQFEITYQRTDGKPAHALANVRVDGTRLSLWTVSLDENVWADSVQSVQAILNSYQVGQ